MGGLRDWNDAVTWANTLSFGGFDDWRLPSTTQPDPTCSNQFDPGAGLPVQGFLLNCIGSEMGHLVNVDGVSASNQGLFVDIQPGFYWSATEFAFDTRNAWMMSFPLEDVGGIPGTQMTDDKRLVHFAWAVRDGDVWTPQQIFDQLIQDINYAVAAGDVKGGQGRLLGLIVEIARGRVDRGRNAAAIGLLNLFTGVTNFLVIIRQIDPAVAEPLLAPTADLIATLQRT